MSDRSLTRSRNARLRRWLSRYVHAPIRFPPAPPPHVPPPPPPSPSPHCILYVFTPARTDTPGDSGSLLMHEYKAPCTLCENVMLYGVDHQLSVLTDFAVRSTVMLPQ